MERQTLEGTWEEILERTVEFAGQRVRVTILSNVSSNLSITPTLDQKHKGRIGRAY